MPDLQGLIILLVIGAIAGWLAGLIMKGGGFGLIGNIIVGVIGAFVGTWLLGMLGVGVAIGSPFVSAIITSLIGALVLLFVIGLVKR
ncbi:MAG: GlsB/YeaQ/YmgE family stress response membrane protein [Hyphomicrobiaceae bacterium]